MLLCCLSVLFLIFSQRAVCDYVRSDEIHLKDDTEPGFQIANLNALLNRDNNLLFKIVNDSSLVNYVELQQSASSRTQLILSKAINYHDLCSSELASCVHILKIVAVNENDFIEIPIEIKRQQKLEKVRVKFDQANFTLTKTRQVSSFEIEAAWVESKRSRKRLNTLLEYQITPEDLNSPKLTLVKLNQTKLKITVNSENLSSLDSFKYKLEAFVKEPDNLSVAKNATILIHLVSKENFDPLEFEQPIYSLEILDSISSQDFILAPKLKKFPVEEKIIFSLFLSSKNQSKIPFEIDENSGVVRLVEEPKDLIESCVDDLIQFSFGVKATYLKLANSSKLTYHQEYMIPAFAKILIKLKHAELKEASFELEPFLPLMNKFDYDIVRLEVNEPFETKWLSLFRLNTALEWEIGGDGIFQSDGSVVNIGKELEDGKVYRGLVRLREKSKKFRPWVKEFKVEVKVDFDPVRFEKESYSLTVKGSDFVGLDLVRIVTKPLKSNSKVVYRIEDVGEKLLEIDSDSGWVKVVRPSRLNDFEVRVFGENVEERKLASVILRVKVDCEIRERNEEMLKFKVYENWKGEIGRVEPVCVNRVVSFNLDESLFAKICSRSNGTCGAFDLGPNARRFFFVDSKSGSIQPNGIINASLFIDELEFNLTLYMQVSIEHDEASVPSFNVTLELPFVASPKIINFYDSLLLSEAGENITDNTCLFKYEFSSDLSIDAPNSIQFLHNNESTNQCLFLINNDGCLSLSKLEKTCLDKDRNESLKSGSYTLGFRVCRLDSTGKSACSQVYNQTLVLVKDLIPGAKLASAPLLSRIDSQAILRSVTSNTYFVTLMLVIGAAAMVALAVLTAAVSKSCRSTRRSNKPSQRADFVLPVKQPIDSNSDNSSSDSLSSNLRVSCNTQETVSSVVNTSGKMSKAEDEDEVKIRVSDDYLNAEKNLSSRFTYSNNNFSYAGSFSSINSSCGSPTTDEPISDESKEISCFRASNEPKQQNVSCVNENQQGLYSVKNGSIHYNEGNGVSVQVRDNEEVVNNCFKTNEIYKTLQAANLAEALNQTQSTVTSNVAKSSSLKKLKKDSALKKSFVAAANNNYSHINSVNSEVMRSHLIDPVRGLYDTYHYLNSKEILLSPDEIIASVV